MRAAARCAVLYGTSSLGDLRAPPEGRLGVPASPVILDLIGHSTLDHHLLRLGGTAIDMLDPAVAISSTRSPAISCNASK